MEIKSSVRPRIVISRCIEFDHCRYDGEIITSNFVRKMRPLVDFLPVCPEVEIGLGIPRAAARLIATRREVRLVQPTLARDITVPMRQFVDRFLSSLGTSGALPRADPGSQSSLVRPGFQVSAPWLPGEVDGFILKRRSPSCGTKEVKLYPRNARSGASGTGPGIFAAAVMLRFPELPIENEGRLLNLRLREHFLTHSYTLARFRQVRAAASVASLVQFHAQHKLLLMAYSQVELRRLGRIVANPEHRPVGEVLADYRARLNAALSAPPRRPAGINALMHALGYFKTGLGRREKAFFLSALEQYRAGRVPLSTPVGILQSWIVRFGQDYLAQQVFFQPFPQELVTLTDTGRGRD
ncbi:MAG: DUF523 and DUF1722 domain-containing protein [candidate division WOR-3 bacterium]